jgi:hypothetical protein
MAYPDLTVVQTDLNVDIAEGNVFQHSVRHAGLADAAGNSLLIRTNNKTLIMDVAGAGELAGILIVREPGSVNAVGVAKTPFNRNRASANTSVVSVSNAASTTSNVDIGTFQYAGGRVPPQRWILASSTDYVIRMVNEGGAAADFGLDLIWKEI